ncbi:N-acetylneuraminate synthase [Candidatus Falkowbacteria bacterium RIFCSPLOWO2_12_FULL_45_13]|uniref:N-acetylneuraminate synthase n=2 Tax=Candidatus Falkowiibacteriota TaxID=1752728 RepID=A0A1F5SCK4_9BACT|nr:MAG: N-acetylneuraminate synthase [Candidatus Falkowbacteria bacterium RIFCSPLOWO2_02_FULL_45_21]OGF31287.1 MAG: N-acetylneuraminate synthase [Candidatus Falkowbacteria bacterium RIFCSPLOWO2_12_FULL_45_13]
MVKKIKIVDKFVGENQPVFIIAEAGVNHNGDLETALKLIDAAAAAGADAVKFQTFRAEEVVVRDCAMAEYQKRNLGKDESQLEMLKKLELSDVFYKPLVKHCRDKGIIFLSTAHGGFKAVDRLESLGVPAYKFGSGDLTNLPLLEYAARLGRPMIISTGMASLAEAEAAISIIKEAGNDKIIILHCTTGYPCPLEEVNLRAMSTMKQKLSALVGYSDHTEGVEVALMAVVLGACLIEKHFTLDNNMSGPDHRASLEPAELKELVRRIRLIEKRLAGDECPENLIKEFKIPQALGSAAKMPTSSELKIAKLVRKSLVAARDINRGEKIDGRLLAIKRPGTGLEPKFFNKILGKIAKKNLKKDQLIKLSDLD